MLIRYLLLLNFFLFSLTVYAAEKKEMYINLLASKKETIPKFIADDIGIKDGHYLYSLEFHNFPENEEIFLFASRLGNKEDVKESFFFRSENGEYCLEWKDGNKSLYRSFMSMEFLPGETLYLRFETKEGKIIYHMNLDPNPISITSKSKNQHLQAHLLSIYPTVYGFSFFELKEGENLKINTDFGTTASNIQTTYTPNNISLSLLLNPPDKIEGEAKVEIKTDLDSFNFHLPWGEELYKYGQEQRIYKH